MVSDLSKEINEFHKRIRARALLIAVEWAGSADKLARMAGLTRHASKNWLKCGHIPPSVALSLSRIKGFPLTFQEMCPAVDTSFAKARRCPHCDREIKPVGRPDGCSPILMRRSEAAARKLADDPAAAARSQRRRRRAAASKL